MSGDLSDVAAAVEDESSFIVFLQALAADRLRGVELALEESPSPWGPSPTGWEHGTIEGFLDAAAAWSLDSRNSGHPDSWPSNPWRRCAEILLAAKSYE
jgi:hypothetical protein